MGSAENRVLNVSKENYCSFRKVSEDLRGYKVYTWGFPWLEKTDDKFDIGGSNSCVFYNLVHNSIILFFRKNLYF